MTREHAATPLPEFGTGLRARLARRRKQRIAASIRLALRPATLPLRPTV